MALSGYSKKCASRNGGIRLIGLIERGAVRSVTFDAQADAWTAVVFEGSARFARYEFREDEARFRETVAAAQGACTVTHELRFFLDRMGKESSRAVDELARASQNGLVAYVQSANEDSFLVGCSLLFGTERPLRLVSASGTTGQTLSESSGETIVLASEDTSKSLPYTGDIDAIFN